MTAISYSLYHHGNGGSSGNEGSVVMVSDTIVYGMLLGLAVSLRCCVYYIATDSH